MGQRADRSRRVREKIARTFGVTTAVLSARRNSNANSDKNRLANPRQSPHPALHRPAFRLRMPKARNAARVDAAVAAGEGADGIARNGRQTPRQPRVRAAKGPTDLTSFPTSPASLCLR